MSQAVTYIVMVSKYWEQLEIIEETSKGLSKLIWTEFIFQCIVAFVYCMGCICFHGGYMTWLLFPFRSLGITFSIVMVIWGLILFYK